MNPVKPNKFARLLSGIGLGMVLASGDLVASEPEPEPETITVADQLRSQKTATGWLCADVLAEMGEAPLPVGDGICVVRFTFRPTFDDPWVFRLQLGEEDTAELYFRCREETRGKGRQALEKGPEWGAMVGEVLRANLGLEKPYGLDGDYWMLEISKDGTYFATDRWCPDRTHTEQRGLTSFVKLCEAMILASGKADAITCWGHPRFLFLQETFDERKAKAATPSAPIPARRDC